MDTRSEDRLGQICQAAINVGMHCSYLALKIPTKETQPDFDEARRSLSELVGREKTVEQVWFTSWFAIVKKKYGGLVEKLAEFENAISVVGRTPIPADLKGAEFMTFRRLCQSLADLALEIEMLLM